MVIIKYRQVHRPQTSADPSSALKAMKAAALIKRNTVYSVFKCIHDLICACVVLPYRVYFNYDTDFNLANPSSSRISSAPIW